MLALKNISVHHLAAASHDSDAPALRGINLSVKAGEQIAIIGPSGAGKTTLLHTLGAALMPRCGEFELMKRAVWQISEAERHRLRGQLFLAPQTPPLPSRQRVVNAVLAGRLPQWSLMQSIRNLIKPKHSDLLAAWQALSQFQLQDKLYARVDRLSGGERQRCALARLLLSNARLLLVDEPLSALDPSLALHTLQVVQNEARQRGATLICSLHQVELARSHFRRIIGLRDGEIVFDATEVSDTMIADLYRNAVRPSPESVEISSVNNIACHDDPRCF